MTIRTVEETEGSFGRIWRLIEKTDEGEKIIIDTYCPWNGDERPTWMDLTPEDRYIRETEILEELQHSLIIGDEDRQREARRQLQENNNDQTIS